MTRGTLRPAVIPQRQNCKNQYDNDKAVYKQRDIVERMFCRIKDWRRIATRFDTQHQKLLSRHRHRRNRHLVAQMRLDLKLAQFRYSDCPEFRCRECVVVKMCVGGAMWCGGTVRVLAL